MATTLYLHNSAYSGPGTLPSTPQSALYSAVTGTMTGASTLKSMNTTPGTSETSHEWTSSTDIAHTIFCGWWCSDPLVGGQTLIADQFADHVVRIANRETSLSMNWGANYRLCAYLWDPSDGSITATIVDDYNPTGDAEPSAANSTRANTMTITSVSSALESVVTTNGEVIIFELYCEYNPANASSYTSTIYFDGTDTANYTTNTVVSDIASRYAMPDTYEFDDGEVDGDANFTLGTLTLSATIEKGLVGAGVFTLGAMTVSSDGDVLTHGAANFTLGSIGGTKTGAVAVAGASSFTLGTMTLVSEGTGPSSNGDAAFTLGALTLSSDGDVAVAGSGAATFAAMTMSSDGDVAIAGSGSATFSTMTASGAGSVTVAAAGAFTFGAMTMTAEGQVIDGTIDGDGAFTLDACTLAAAGVAVVAGAFARTLADMTVEGTIELSAVPINGSASFTLESMTTSGDGDVFVVGAGAFTLGQMTLESSSEPLQLRGIDAFTAEFRPGDIDDRIHNFLLFYTTGTDASWTNKDLWIQFLSERGFSDGSLRDRLKEFLKDYLALSGERSLHDLWGLVTGPYAE